MLNSLTRVVAVLGSGGLLMIGLPRIGHAQTESSFSACTTGVLSNCSVIQLTSQLGIGPGGTNFFEIAIQNLGSQATPTVATSIYNLVFATGQPDAAARTQIDASVAPADRGGASVIDASPWDLFDAGSAIFLSAVSGNGVGGCVGDAPVGGFGQAGQTCGESQFLAFGFFTTRAYDPSVFSLLDLEVVGLTDDLPADSCNDATPCVLSAAPETATPEAGTMGLFATGLVGLVGALRRRKSTAPASPAPATER